MAKGSVAGFGFPAICRKKVTAAFDGGRLTSDGGVLLLAQAERAMGIAGRLAGCIADPRDQSRVVHGLTDILRARMLAIACGYEDADDLDHLRHDPGFKLAVGKLPGGAIGLASQPTMSRWENAPTTRELVRMMGAMVDLYCASYPVPPAAVTLDIDETVDVVHGGQQLSFWNGHYGERCFLPLHVYDTATGRPVAMLLRTGKTPSGAEIAGHTLQDPHNPDRQRHPVRRAAAQSQHRLVAPERLRFDMICEANDIEHRLTKPNHPWTNGQVERTNRTIKEATVKRFHYDNHEQLRVHLAEFMAAYNFARRLKTLSGLTPYEYLAKIWTAEPERFIVDQIHQMPGLNT